MTTTLVVLRLDTAEPVAIRTTFLDQPPIISIEFPERRVIGSLPEDSAIRTGIIQGVATRYDDASTAGPSGRPIRALEIRLSAPYAHRVRSEAGRVVVEIEHPASIRGASVEVGVRGGAIVKGFLPQRVSERFLAMEQALIAARPSESDASPKMGRQPAAAAPAPVAASAPRPAPASTPEHPADRSREWSPEWAGILGALVLLGAWLAWQRMSRSPARRTAKDTGPRLPSAIVLIDELVWHAFERQGYQSLQTSQLAQPPGTLRVMTKEGGKALLSCVGNGTFFEKQTVERFVAAMREAGAAQGFLVASGAFTVPAQRRAKEAHVTLLGREQLTELLSAGAMTEHFTRQIQEAHTRLEESRETLRQYAEQLDTLRRQRNEASWYLGEERAKAGTLEAQLDEATQHVRHLEAELERAQRETETLRKQWEESQWYLGESRERSRHLERQVGELQSTAQQVEAAQRERDEAHESLGEARTQLETHIAKAARLQGALDESVQRELVLQDAFDEIRRTLSALQTYGERRQAARAALPEATIELRNGREASSLTGALRDVSISGVGLGTEREIDAASLRLCLRLPGVDEPIESRAQLVWQVSEGEPPRYRSGFRFISLPSASRERLEEILARQGGG